MGKQLLAIESFKIELGEGLFLKGEVKTVEDGAAKPVLVVSHGFRGHKDWGFWREVTSRFAEQGFYTVSFDFSRIGARNEGLDERIAAAASTVSRELLDLEALVARLREEGLPLAGQAAPERLAILGHSRSGGSSIIYASEHSEVRAVVVWNGGAVPNRPETAPGQVLTLQEQAILADVDSNEERYDIAGKFASLTVPALLVQGAQDNERLLTQNWLLQDVAPKQHFVSIAGGNHTFGAVDPYEGTTHQLDEAVEATVQFLKQAY